tara:strand:+ start:2379 stop:2801 length:423 start_codon:yes stop_codon:yes gene_type:complete
MPRKSRRNNRPVSDINIVPYVDVMLVLLVIFMITAPLLTEGVNVDLPKAEANLIDSDSKRPIVFSVNEKGIFFITYDDNKSLEVSKEDLLSKAKILIKSNPRAPILVKGDRNVLYDQIVQLMVLLQQSGASKVGMLTDPD